MRTGNELRHLREQAGISRQQLADRCGSTHGKIMGMEHRGPKTPEQEAMYLGALSRDGEVGSSDGPPATLADLKPGDLIKYVTMYGTSETLTFKRYVEGDHPYVEAIGSMGYSNASDARQWRDTGQWRALYPDRVRDMRGAPLAAA